METGITFLILLAFVGVIGFFVKKRKSGSDNSSEGNGGGTSPNINHPPKEHEQIK